MASGCNVSTCNQWQGLTLRPQLGNRGSIRGSIGRGLAWPSQLTLTNAAKSGLGVGLKALRVIHECQGGRDLGVQLEELQQLLLAPDRDENWTYNTSSGELRELLRPLQGKSQTPSIDQDIEESYRSRALLDCMAGS